jgi:hypothetical protein
MVERTSAGLDVHARSVVAAGLDSRTGEVFKQRLVPASEVVIEWLRAAGPGRSLLRGRADRVRSEQRELTYQSR